MKSFQQFNEDLRKLQQDLNTLDKQHAPAERLAARRRLAAERSRTLASDFQKRQKEIMQAQKERMQAQRERMQAQQNEELQTEQTPTMEPNYYSQQVARRQAAQKTAHIKHVHQELGASARAQEAAKRARLKSIMSR